LTLAAFGLDWEYGPYDPDHGLAPLFLDLETGTFSRTLLKAIPTLESFDIVGGYQDHYLLEMPGTWTMKKSRPTDSSLIWIRTRCCGSTGIVGRCPMSIKGHHANFSNNFNV
jgi:hypothetical protein